MPSSLTLAVVGAQFANKGKSPSRRFAIALCRPGDPVELRREPKNQADEYAIAVFSDQGVQMGYLTAERAAWLAPMLDRGRVIRAIFQDATPYGALVRAAFDGEAPVLPPPRAADRESDRIDHAADESGFYPDWIPPDD